MTPEVMIVATWFYRLGWLTVPLSLELIYNHWTGPVDWNWVDWTGGLDWWTGLVDSPKSFVNVFIRHKFQ